MQKIYHIKHLHCANCANKIETALKNHLKVEAVRLDFINQKLYISSSLSNEELLKLICTIEDGVELEEAIHCHGGCCHHHDHSHHHHEHELKELKHAHKLYISGLDCANCANKVEKHLQNLAWVDEVSLHFSSGCLYVRLKKHEDFNQRFPQLQQAINEVESNVVISKTKDNEKSHSKYYSLLPLLAAVIVFGVAMFVKVQEVTLLLFIISYILAGGKVLKKAIQNILRRDVFDENFLMMIATLGAFAIAAYEEAIAVMIFYELGEWFQSLAVDKSRKSIADLMDLKVETATVFENGEYKIKKVEAVRVHDLIVVKAGERIAMDGIIQEGSAQLDTSALTGESKLLSVDVNDEVLSGMINTDGNLLIEVSKVYQEGTLATILEMVEHAGSKKAHMERFITKFARVYTPIVVFTAIAFFIGASILVPQVSYQVWLYRALTFLVVSCPCALVISIPLGLFAAIGSASRKGILIKGGNVIEGLHKLDHIVFDKTGTITKGNFIIDEINSVKQNEDELLMFAAHAELNSNHPLAKAIVKAYDKVIDRTILKDVKEIAGQGIMLQYQDKELLVGNEKLMNERNVAYTPCSSIHTPLYIAYDGIYQGCIIMRDEVKDEAKQTIEQLRKNAISKISMVSGDQEAVVASIANEVGINDYYAKVLPQAKVSVIEQLLVNKKQNTTLAFVGDGINDAPVLARVDVGISMGLSGSDAAIEASDVVLMNDDLRSLVDAVGIANKTMRILYQNIIVSLGIKMIILLLSAMGIASMWWGVFGDVGVTLLAIMNAMRILKNS